MRKKLAFTLLEMVFVIIVLGILASIAMNNTERDLKQEASETILSHIRLAQQLALNDNKHRADGDLKWQMGYWQFAMKACGDDIAYRVGSDTSLRGGVNGIGKGESAINPADGKYIYSDDCSNIANDETSSVLLTKKFGIKNSGVVADGGCDRRQILFDYFGRPHYRNTSYNTPFFQNIMREDCNLTFTLSTDQDGDGNPDSFTITIEAETGHSFIVGQENS
jgi:prepilin-type N-terminal cleavage/methylation domain-containing protein